MALKTRAVTKESVLAALALEMSVVSVEVDADGAADVVVVDIVARNHCGCRVRGQKECRRLQTMRRRRVVMVFQSKNGDGQLNWRTPIGSSDHVAHVEKKRDVMTRGTMFDSFTAATHKKAQNSWYKRSCVFLSKFPLPCPLARPERRP